MTDRDRRLAASLERLVPRRIERDEWDEIVARADRRVVRIRRYRVPRRALAASAVVLAAVIAALLVASPWRNGPSVIATASAALAAPAGSVVYEEVRFPATDRLCVTSQPGDGAACPLATVERTRLWVQHGVGTSTFRAVTTMRLPKQLVGRKLLPLAPFGDSLYVARTRDLVLETGGTFGPKEIREALFHQQGAPVLVRFDLRPSHTPSLSLDPARLVHDALQTGHARLLGPATVRGRRVERIALTFAAPYGRRESAVYEVDARTFLPVEIVFERGAPGYPFVTGFGSVRGRVTLAFTAYRTLPATRANLGLTNIRAQNPHARIVCGERFGLPDC